jgi:membrane protein YdbS with pleckstrin-like domain/DNA-directed RNA polymerase subunit RPC12/RpoP
MADVKFDCTHCGEHLEAEAQMRGQKMECPACKSEVVVPAQATPEPALPVARLADPESAPPGPAAPAEEQEVFDIQPTASAFLGHILLGIVVALLGAGVVLFLREAYSAWYKDTIGRGVQAGIVLAPLLVGIVMLLRVWAHMASLHYRLTTQRLFVRRGLIAKHISELELFRIKDVTVNQSLFQRILGFGTITVLSADNANPEVDMVGIRNPVEVKETIRNHYRAARKREGVASTEFSPS